MSPKKEEYLRKAEEAEAKAASARDPHVRQTYLEVARHWRELIEHSLG